MHPQSSDIKRIGTLLRRLIHHRQLKLKNTLACREFFDALELCHADVWAKWTGGCNQAKRELNKCLHGEVRLPPFPGRPFLLTLSCLVCETRSKEQGGCKATECAAREGTSRTT